MKKLLAVLLCLGVIGLATFQQENASAQDIMDNKIKDVAKQISESAWYAIADIGGTKIKDLQKVTKKELPEECTDNIFFESVYFSVNYILKNIPKSYSFENKKLLEDELNKDFSNLLIEFVFKKNNPVGYQDKIRAIYYDTLNARNLAYTDPNNINMVVFKEILYEEFEDAKIQIDKHFFDSISVLIISKLDGLIPSLNLDIRP